MRAAKVWVPLLAVALCSAALAYEHWFYQAGGLFCGTYEGADARHEQGAACFSTGVSMRHLAISHLGDESMFLLKLGAPLFERCYWVDMDRYHVTVNGGDISRAPSCGTLAVDIEPKT